MPPIFWLHQGEFLAQIEDAAQPLSENLFTDITFVKVLQAITTVAIAYGSLWLIQLATDWLSERVARRFRLMIKQAMPFWKALILIVSFGLSPQSFSKFI